jgi:hypothetical protein
VSCASANIPTENSRSFRRLRRRGVERDAGAHEQLGTTSYGIGSGYGHVAIGCSDIRAACDRVRAAGGKVTREPGPMKHGTTVLAFVQDPDGYEIELPNIPRPRAEQTLLVETRPNRHVRLSKRVCDEERNLLSAVAKPGDLDGVLFDAVVGVLSKCASGNAVAERPIRGGDDLHSNTPRLGG